MLRKLLYLIACCLSGLLTGPARAQSCEDYFETALRTSAELKHPAEFRVRMGTVVRGNLRGEQLFGAGGIARGEKGDTLEAKANFHWARQHGTTGQNATAFQAVRRESMRLTFARDGRRLVIRITGTRKPVLLEARCADGLVYAEDRISGGTAVWVFHLPFVNPCCITTGQKQNAVLTQHNDIKRTGAYLSETRLTPQKLKNSSVALGGFAHLWTFDVDGQVYAQPLYVPDVTLEDGTHHNVLYVATSTNHVYAFDADDPLRSSNPLLQVQLGAPADPSDLNHFGSRYNVVYPNIGITSTPVIDLSTNTIYLVAKIVCQEKSIRVLQDQIFALDLTSLAVKDSAGTAGIPVFSLLNKNRAGLLLVNGRVYVGYGELNNEYQTDPNQFYHGLIFSFDANNLASPPAVFNTSTDYYGAGVWQSGNGLASDGTYIYVNTGNGGLTFQSGKLGDSVLKLSANLQLVQSYTPANVQCLDTCDLDLGSSGPVLFPGSNILLSGGKEGIFYVFSSTDISTTSQCPFRAADQPGFGNQVPICSIGTDQNGCEIPNPAKSCTSINTPYSNIHGAPVILQTGQDQYQVYVWPEENILKMFRYTGGHLLHDAIKARGSDAQAPPSSMPGGVMSLSADPIGRNAILWGSAPKDCTQTGPGSANCAVNDEGAIHASIPGRFVAFDANTLEELWSDLDVGYFAKFTPPTVADGKVFVANFGSSNDCGGDYLSGSPQKSCGQVRVYGLRPIANVPVELVRWPYSWIDPGPLAPRLGVIRP